MKSGLCGKGRLFLIWTLIFTLAFPTPLFSGTLSSGDHNEFVLRRLNSPERAAATAEMHEKYAKQQAEQAASEKEEKKAVKTKPSAPPSGSSVAGSGASGTAEMQGRTSASAANAAPRSATEVLFNQGASLVGLPGLAPRQGADGSRDEGMGFHQDGTVRKAADSDDRHRAPAYMRAGAGVPDTTAPGLYDDAARLEELSSSGGRVSGQSSREFNNLDPNEVLLNRGLNYGSGILNSWGESVLSGLVDGGRARLNYRLDSDGDVGGEGDALLPWYDGTCTTVFTQIGARSMTDDEKTRWIGNFGLGQRWFPFASGELGAPDYDAGTLMFGYNAFFDYDFTRSHQRGGVGAELQYDWLRLSSNYYFPLSGWRGSYDFDSSLVEERPAEGWDARIKAYLPFYRNVALTGSYSRWYGDNVGVYGASDLEKNPRVWSYGIEYTPIPLISGFLRQKSTEHGRTDTEFGLTFNYHFGMSLEEQTSPSKVAELRSVGGSRHEFVDRENKIILEYRAKNAFRIEYVGKAGTNRFDFRLVNGFDRTVSGQTVHAGITDATFPNGTDFATFVTDHNGKFTLVLDTVMATPVPATLQAGETTGNFNLDAELTELNLKASPDTLTQHKSQSVTFTITRKDGSPMSGASVVFNAHAGFSKPGGTYTTDGSGKFTVPDLTAVLSGQQPLSVMVNGKTTAKATFSVTAATYVLTADTDTLAQHEPTDVTFTLTRNGETVPGLSVLFTKGEGFASLPADAQTTDASGQFKVPGLKAIRSGAQTVEVSVDNDGAASKAFTVTAATYDLNTSDTLQQWEAAKTVTFTLKRNSKNLADAPVAYAVSGLGGPDVTGSTTTDGNGAFRINNVATTLSSDASVSVTVDGQNLPPETLKVTAATYSLSTTDTLQQREPAKSVTFTLKTGKSTPVSGASVTYTISNLGGADITGSATTNGNGEFTVNNVATTLSSDASASVTVDGKTVNTTVSVTSASYTLSTSDTLQQWEAAKTVAFTLRTKNNTPVSGASVTYTISKLGGADLTGSATTNGNGEFTVDGVATILGTAADASVTVDGKTVNTTISVTSASYTLSTSDPLQQWEPARTVTFTLKTGKSTPVSGASVTYTISNLGGADITGSATTNGNGEFTVNNVATTLSSDASASVTVDGKTVNTTVSVTSASYTLSTSDTLQQWEAAKTVAFTLRTKNNTPVSGASVTYTISKLGGADLTGSATTNSNGEFTVDGVATILSTAADASVTVDGKTANTTIGIMSASYTLSTSDTLHQWEAAKPVTFTLRTKNNTPVSGASVSYVISKLGGADLTGTATTNGSGEFTVNNVATSLSSDANVNVTVDGKIVPGTLKVTAATYNLSTTDTLQQWEPAKAVTFTLRTGNNTPVSGASVSYTISKLSGADLTGSATTNVNGEFTVNNVATTLNSDASVSVTVDGKAVPGTLTVTAATYDLSVSPQTLIQHVGTDVTFTIKRNNKTVAGLAATFAANADLGLNGTTRNTDGNGQITLKLTPKATGTKTVQVTVDGQPLPASLQVEAPNYTLETSDSLSQHDPGDVTFTVKRNGQLVSGLSVVFTANADLGLTAVTQSTNGNGQVTVAGLKSATAGQKKVEVTVDNLGKADTTLTVTPATYKLVPSITSLTQYEPENVTFTLTTAKGTIVPNMNVSFTSSANSNFTGLPAAASTNGSGQIPVNPLTSTHYESSQTVTATVDGKNATAQFTVTEATFLLTATPATMVQYEKESTTFTLTTSKGTKVPGLNVTFPANAAFANTDGTHIPDTNGAFTLSDLIATASGEQTIAVAVNGRGNTTTKFKVAKLTFDITSVTNGGDFVSGGTSTASLTGQLKADGTPYTPRAQAEVVWSVTAADNSSNKAVMDTHKTRKTGLAWGTSGPGDKAGEELITTVEAPISGTSPITVNLTDVMGERTVTIQAKVNINGYTVMQDQNASFGKGPLSVFAGPPKGNMDWTSAISACGGTVDLNIDGYQRATNLPLDRQLRAVADGTGNSAYLAAGWPDNNSGYGYFSYWTGSLFHSSQVIQVVSLHGGNSGDLSSIRNDFLAVCLPPSSR